MPLIRNNLRVVGQIYYLVPSILIVDLKGAESSITN